MPMLRSCRLRRGPEAAEPVGWHAHCLCYEWSAAERAEWGGATASPQWQTPQVSRHVGCPPRTVLPVYANGWLHSISKRHPDDRSLVLVVLQGLTVVARSSVSRPLAARLTRQMPPLSSTTLVGGGGCALQQGASSWGAGASTRGWVLLAICFCLQIPLAFQSHRPPRRRPRPIRHHSLAAGPRSRAVQTARLVRLVLLCPWPRLSPSVQ